MTKVLKPYQYQNLWKFQIFMFHKGKILKTKHLKFSVISGKILPKFATDLYGRLHFYSALLSYAAEESATRKHWPMSGRIGKKFGWLKKNTSLVKKSYLQWLKGLSCDRFQKFWQKFSEIGLIKGRGWLLNFSEAPLIFSWQLKRLSREIDANLTVYIKSAYN